MCHFQPHLHPPHIVSPCVPSLLCGGCSSWSVKNNIEGTCNRVATFKKSREAPVRMSAMENLCHSICTTARLHMWAREVHSMLMDLQNIYEKGLRTWLRLEGFRKAHWTFGYGPQHVQDAPTVRILLPWFPKYIVYLAQHRSNTLRTKLR